MKQIFVILFLVSIHTANAKFEDKNAIYTTGELNVGNYIGVGLNLNYVYNEEYSFSIGYTGNIRKPITQPDNFSSGFVGIMFFGLSNPFDHFDTYHLSVGQIYKLDKSGAIRVNFSAGLGYTTIKEPENWEVNGDGIVGTNYTWDYNEYNTISFIINPRIEYLYSRYFGLTLSPMLQINKDRINYGIGAGLMIGLLRK